MIAIGTLDDAGDDLRAFHIIPKDDSSAVPADVYCFWIAHRTLHRRESEYADLERFLARGGTELGAHFRSTVRSISLGELRVFQSPSFEGFNTYRN